MKYNKVHEMKLDKPVKIFSYCFLEGVFFEHGAHMLWGYTNCIGVISY